MHVTEDQAEQGLRDDLHNAEHVVETATEEASTTDNQFSAMVAFCFNVGSANFASGRAERDLADDNSPPRTLS